jgi:dihydroxyacetone kinase-like protein
VRDKITSDDVIAILQKMAGEMEGAKDYLTELDSAMGDGDQGVTMTIGFRAIKSKLPELEGKDIGTILIQSGLTFNRTAASTIGALLATAFGRAGREVREKTEIGLPELVAMTKAAQVGLYERGKAEVGDKTLMDTVVPLVAALQKAYDEGATLPDALLRSLAAAEEGMKSTIPMRAKMGRASWIADRSVGNQDPGATSFYLMWKSFVDYVTAG